MLYINSETFFNAVINAADSMGFLADLKKIMPTATASNPCKLRIDGCSEFECSFSYDYDSADIFIYGGKVYDSPCIGNVTCPDYGPRTYAVVGAAAALLQYVTNELILRLNWFGDTSSPMEPDSVLDCCTELLYNMVEFC